MPIPRIPSKAHLIVPGNPKQIKKDGSGDNEDSLQGTSQDTEDDVKPMIEERPEIQRTFEKMAGEQEVKNEVIDNKVVVDTLPMEVASPEVAENEVMHGSHQMTINIPIKKEKPKRNKQKKSNKSENSMASDSQLSSDIMRLSDSPKGVVNSVADGEMAATVGQVNSVGRSVPVSNGPAKSSGSIESVTSINARTASLLAAHLKNVKNTVTTSKYGSPYPLNLSSNGKETGNLEAVISAVSSSS
jgi:hypothetical protein